MKRLFYLLLFCSWAIVAQEQKYILLDSLMAKYTVKQYTLDTSPYGPKNTIEMYNVFSKGYGVNGIEDYIVLFSVLPDLESKSNWEEIDFKKIKNNLFPTKNLFLKIVGKVASMQFRNDTIDINQVKLVKKVKDKHYVSKNIWIDSFYCMDYPYDMQVATKDFILNTNQPIKPISQLKEDYKKVIPYHPFPLDDDFGFLIPDILEGTYLSDIEEKGGDKMYHFYQFCNDNFIYKFVYIKGKGIVAGAYVYFFYSKGRRAILGGDWKKVIHDGRKPLLWAEELKKEWDVSHTGKEKYKR